jgi:hypothetical protein
MELAGDTIIASAKTLDAETVNERFFARRKFIFATLSPVVSPVQHR